MRIEGDGFVLRAPRPDDARAVARAFEDDPDLAVQWGVDEPLGEAEAALWMQRNADRWEAGERMLFVIADPDSDELLGVVNFHRYEEMHRRSEVGFWLVLAARGRGIGTRAVEAACRLQFERLGLHRIEMTTLPGNEAARAMASKVGFREEGILRGRNHERGEQVDIAMLGLLASDLSPETQT